MNSTLFILACAGAGTFLSLAVAVVLAWWVERTDPDRWKRL